MKKENEGLTKFAEKILTKEFTHKDSKDAYLKACRWLAVNVVPQVELRNVMYEIHKVNDSQLPTFRIIIYATFDEKEMREDHCSICKQFHESFFLREKCQCDRCELKAYQKRADTVLSHRRSFIKDKLEG